MSEAQVLQILSEVRPLALKLTDTSQKYQLDAAELARLEKFQRLQKAGYTYYKLKLLAERVRLDPIDLAILNWFCNQLEITTSYQSSFDTAAQTA